MTVELQDLVLDTARELGSAEIDEADDFGPQTKLFGEDGLLDSMGLVTLVIAIEQAIEDAYGESVALADEKALSQANSPYRTVETLVEYARAQLAGS